MANILIVDDSLKMRQSLSAILIEAGHTIVGQAGNGLQACMEYEKFCPDLVTLDIDMPFLNGIDTLKSIIRKHPKANILMVANASSSLIYEALSLGAKGYVMKPFCIQEFISVVNGIVQSENHLASSSIEKIHYIISNL